MRLRFSFNHKSLLGFIFAVVLIVVWLCCASTPPQVDGELEICTERRYFEQPCCQLNQFRRQPDTCAEDCARTPERARELGERSSAGCYSCANYTLAVERCGLCYVQEPKIRASIQHPDRTQCLVNARNFTLQPNAVGIFRLRLYDAHASRLSAAVITDSGELVSGGVTRHFSEAKAALRFAYGPARGFLHKISEDFVGDPICSRFDARHPRVGMRAQDCLDTHEWDSVSYADESPTGIYYFWLQATEKGWSGGIVPSLEYAGALSDGAHLTLAMALVASLPTSFIALAACACARLRWLAPEKQRDRREGLCVVFAVVAFMFAASPALYASFVIHERLSILW